MMLMPGAKIAWPNRSFRKETPRAIGDAGNGAGEMTQQARRLVGMKHHRHGLGFHAAGIEPLDGLLAGGAPDLLGAAQIARMAGAGVIIVAFHAGAFAGQHRDADTVAGAGIAAVEARCWWPARRRCARRRRRRLPELVTPFTAKAAPSAPRARSIRVSALGSAASSRSSPGIDFASRSAGARPA